jgi:hypothetical protein
MSDHARRLVIDLPRFPVSPGLDRGSQRPEFYRGRPTAGKRPLAAWGRAPGGAPMVA